VEQPEFGPGFLGDSRNKRQSRKANDPFQMLFAPYYMELLTRFAHGGDDPVGSSIPREDVCPKVKKG
jgi:hypothetical protein